MKRQGGSGIDRDGAPDVGEPVFLEAPPSRRSRPGKSQASFRSLLRILFRGHRMERCH